MQFSKEPKHDSPEDSVLSAASDSDALDGDFPLTGSVYGSVEPHIFTDQTRADHWRSVYEKARYECRHRFDPSFQWSAQDEKRAARKVFLKSPLSSPTTIHRYNISKLTVVILSGRLADHASCMGHVFQS